jgi:hypothetical protein
MAQDMQEKLLETLPQESRLDQQIPAPQVSTRGMGNRDVQVENMMAEERTKEIVDEIENNPSVFQRMANYFISFFEQREPKAEGGSMLGAKPRPREYKNVLSNFLERGLSPSDLASFNRFAESSGYNRGLSERDLMTRDVVLSNPGGLPRLNDDKYELRDPTTQEIQDLQTQDFLSDSLVRSLVDRKGNENFLRNDNVKAETKLLQQVLDWAGSHNKGSRLPKAEGGKFPDLNKDGEVTYADILKGRGVYAEGGDVDDQMGVLIAIQPSEEEMNDEMLPDGEMEDDYIDYIISNSLNPEEENYLLSKLEQDDQLSMLFDKVIETASEFSGTGPVEGPGSGISDSIPARLSDGEFVFTAKATEQIGADTLQRMMEDAEAEADQRQPAYNGGEMEEQPSKVIESTVRVTKPVNRNVPALGIAQEAQLRTDEEIKKNMLNPNVNYIRS